MGQWTIVVEGQGAHHNGDYPGDADRLFDGFVEMLRQAGHAVTHSSFTHSGRQGPRELERKALSTVDVPVERDDETPAAELEELEDVPVDVAAARAAREAYAAGLDGLAVDDDGDLAA